MWSHIIVARGHSMLPRGRVWNVYKIEGCETLEVKIKGYKILLVKIKGCEILSVKIKGCEIF